MGLEGRRSTGDRDAPISNGHLFDTKLPNSRVKLARDEVGCLLNVGLFRVRLERGRSLVGKRLSALFDNWRQRPKSVENV